MKILLSSLIFSLGVYAQVIEETVAAVDDEVILLSELKAYQRLLSSPLSPSSVLFKLKSKKNIRSSRFHLLNFMIDERVLKTHLPMEQMPEVSKEAALSEELKRKGISRRKMRSFLRKIKLSENDYQEILYHKNLYERWIQMEVSSQIQVSHEEVNDYYFEKNKKNLFKKYKYDLRQWSFELSKKGRKEAQKFSDYNRILTTTPKEIRLSQDQMNSDLRKAVSKLALGQRSSPICFGSYCYVFELIHKSLVNNKKLRAEKIRKKLFEKAFLSKLKIWMETKRKASLIKKYI